MVYTEEVIRGLSAPCRLRAAATRQFVSQDRPCLKENGRFRDTAIVINCYSGATFARMLR